MADNPDPVVTTAEVAEFLDFSKSGTRKRLYPLVDEGYLDYKKSGKVPMWWITDEGREFIESED